MWIWVKIGESRENWSKREAAASDGKSVAPALTKTLLLNRGCDGSPKTLACVSQLLNSLPKPNTPIATILVMSKSRMKMGV